LFVETAMRFIPRMTLAVALVILVLPASSWGCRSTVAKCAVCERAECTNMAFGIHMMDGKTVDACCPRCGLRYIAAQHPSVASLSVRGFDTGAPLDATRAFYVEGSRVTPCTSAGHSLPKDERGCCMGAVYDRCLPSLLAFDSKPKADAFAREHGGFVRTLTDIRTAKS
jgi:hypothetical protein